MYKAGDYEGAIEIYQQSVDAAEASGDQKLMENFQGELEKSFEKLSQKINNEGDKLFKEKKYEEASKNYIRSIQLATDAKKGKLVENFTKELRKTYEKWSQALTKEASEFIKKDNYENAFPLLRKYGYTATFFIFTQPIDFGVADYLTWDMVIEMDKAGMEFGSHSYSHPDMRGQDVDFLVFEILASKEAIEERTGELVRFFAYPSGRYDDFLIHVLKTAHFWGAVTTEWGAEQAYNDRFEMLRVRVAGK